jgi:two-component system nitrogen regulation response regulator NtrX
MSETTATTQAAHILVVDDEPGVRAALEGILGDEGFRVTSVASGEEALAATEQQRFDAALLDIWLPGKDGLEILLELRERRLDLEVVMISGHGTVETAVRATKLGAFDFVEKPLSLEKTLLVLRNALRQRRLERRNRHLLEQLTRDTEIVGRSPAMETLRAAIGSAAASEASVLIHGERGTGRETIARRVHAASARADEAFVDISPAAMAEGAIPTALFGDSDGNGGRLGLAAGGVLFVDEAETLPAPQQQRLAAALAQAEPPRARAMASVADPAALEPALRQRLDVIRIDVPPLRSHRDDVQQLAERFMADLSREYGIPPKRISPEALAALRAWDWPGNVRELRNLTERLLLMVSGESVGVDDLPRDLGGAGGPAEDLYREFESLAEGLATFERYLIRRTLAATRGDVAEAAERLMLKKGRLESRMAELGLS